jgi:hypothetical protein
MVSTYYVRKIKIMGLLNLVLWLSRSNISIKCSYLTLSPKHELLTKFFDFVIRKVIGKKAILLICRVK